MAGSPVCLTIMRSMFAQPTLRSSSKLLRRWRPNGLTEQFTETCARTPASLGRPTDRRLGRARAHRIRRSSSVRRLGRRRRLVIIALDQPRLVEDRDPCGDGEPDFFCIPESARPKQLLFQRAEEALDAAIARGRARRRDSTRCQGRRSRAGSDRSCIGGAWVEQRLRGRRQPPERGTRVGSLGSLDNGSPRLALDTLPAGGGCLARAGKEGVSEEGPFVLERSKKAKS